MKFQLNFRLHVPCGMTEILVLQSKPLDSGLDAKQRDGDSAEEDTLLYVMHRDLDH